MNMAFLALEIVVGFIILFVLVKVIGKKIINQITPFTFIGAIVLGELLGNALYDEKIGVRKKSSKQKVQQEDIKLPPQTVYVPVTLIRDGDLLEDELKDINKDASWLMKQLQQEGIDDYRNVFIAEWLEGDGLLVQTFEQVSH